MEWWAELGSTLGDDDIQPSLIMPFTEVSLKLKYCQSDGMSTITSLCGYLNESEMKITETFTAESECVMFLGSFGVLHHHHHGQQTI